MSRTATHDDANLILRLYELRREPRMREAREWFVSTYKPTSLAHMGELAPPGTPANASLRMVTSYWDMVASFVTSGVLEPTLFYQSNMELLLVYARVRHIIPEMRKAFNNNAALRNLETVALGYIEHVERDSPGLFEAFAQRTGAPAKPESASA